MNLERRDLYLGVDGGQSHTEAVVADAAGRIVGVGTGGPSNHAEIPGGRERLRSAVRDSVSRALGLADPEGLAGVRFRAAHFGMTGGADYKDSIIRDAIAAELLAVGHDAPTALAGGTCGAPGVVVISGTGSVAYGENAAGQSARAGGLGYLFSDVGSGFWLAAEAIRLAIREQDGIDSRAGIEEIVLDHFGVREIRELTTAFYNGFVSRDAIAGLARTVQTAAGGGNERLAARVRDGARGLAELVGSVAARLGFGADGYPVVGVGGMFQGAPLREALRDALGSAAPGARFREPRFRPAIGALLLAYRADEIEISSSLLMNLETSQER